jgi:hypothetical protein
MTPDGIYRSPRPTHSPAPLPESAGPEAGETGRPGAVRFPPRYPFGARLGPVFGASRAGHDAGAEPTPVSPRYPWGARLGAAKMIG